MVQNGFHLISLNSGKPLKEFLDRCSIAEILKERRNRHSGSLKHPYTTNLVDAAFHSV